MTGLLSEQANGFCQTYDQELIDELIETGTISGYSDEQIAEIKEDLKRVLSALYEAAY